MPKKIDEIIKKNNLTNTTRNCGQRFGYKNSPKINSYQSQNSIPMVLGLSKLSSITLTVLLILYLVSAGILIYPQSVSAATNTWDGGCEEDTTWSCAENWSKDTVPVAEDTVVFKNTSDNDSVIDEGFDGTITTLNINSGYDGTITMERSLTVSSNFTQTGGVFDLNGQTLTVNRTFTLSAGTFTHSNGTIEFSGNKGGTLSCNNTEFNLVTFTYTSGTKKINSNCNLPLGEDPIVSRGGSLSLKGTLSGTGTLTKGGGSFYLKSTAVLDGFTGLVTNGLQIDGATFDASDYTILDLNNRFLLNSGTFIAPAGTMTVTGDFTIAGGTFTHSGGTLTFDGTRHATLSCNNTEFNLVTFTNTNHKKTVNSNCNLPLGENPIMDGNIILSGTISGTGTLTKDSGILVLNSTAVLNGFTGLITNRFKIAGASFDANNYTTLDINDDFSITSGGFIAPTGILPIGGDFTISGGTFTHSGGTLTFDGTTATTLSCNNIEFNLVTFEHTGSITVDNNCTLPLGNNPNTNYGSIINNGTLTAGGTWTVNGNLTNNGTVNFSGSTINLKGNFAQSGTFDLTDKTIIFDGLGSDLECNGELGGTVQISLTGGVFSNSAGCSISLGANPVTTVGSHLLNNGTITVASGNWTEQALDDLGPLVSRSDMGADLTGTNKWNGGSILGPNGKIYGIPLNSADILIIDPAAGTAIRTDMGLELSAKSKWSGGVLGPDGKIYGIPQSDANILIIDPTLGTAIRTDMGLELTGAHKWCGGVLGPDGKIYAIPDNVEDMLIIDPIAGTAIRSDMGAIFETRDKYSRGVLGPDGKIYGTPHSETNILIIDPTLGTAIRSDMGADLSNTNKWSGGVVGPDNKIYAPPRDVNDILIIDPALGTARRSNMGADLTGLNKWSGGILGQDGKIYTTPRNSENFLIIDPVAGTAIRSDLGADLTGSAKWRYAISGPDGKIYFIPRNATNILIIDFNTPSIVNNGTIIHNGTGWETDSSLVNNGTIIYNGTLTFNGSIAQNLTCGNSSFNNLTIQNTAGFTFLDNCTIGGYLTSHTPGTTITFNAGSTYNIDNFNLVGSASQRIILSSSVSGSPWLINSDNRSSTFSYVSVSDSDASQGLQIDAIGNTDNGNNSNWLFAYLIQSRGRSSLILENGQSDDSLESDSQQQDQLTTDNESETVLADDIQTDQQIRIDDNQAQEDISVTSNLPEVRIIVNSQPQDLAASLNQSRNQNLEQQVVKNFSIRLPEASGLNSEHQQALSNFVVYGIQETQKLGQGERAGSVYSFENAFDKLPQTEQDWSDVLNISLGKLPSQKLEQRENQVKIDFEKIYLRKPGEENQNDKKTLDIMAYGIRPLERNLNSERTAIGYFQSIYNKIPQTTADWDIVRAISYGGVEM